MCARPGSGACCSRCFFFPPPSPCWPAPPPAVTLAPTVVATGFRNAGGIAFDGLGNLYVADFGNGAVEEILAVNGVIPQTNPVVKTLSSSFNQPYDVAVDSLGNVFVVDSSVPTVYEIEATSVGVFPNSPTVHPLVSNENLAQSTAIAVDSHGNLFVGGSFSQTVMEIHATSLGVYPGSPTVTKVDSSFTAQYLDGIAVDSKGNLFVTDGNTNTLYEIAATSVGVYPPSPVVTTLTGDYTYLAGVRVDARGNLFFVDYAPSGGVFELQANGVGVYPAKPAILQLATFAYPWSAAPDSLGNVFVMEDLTYSSNVATHKPAIADPSQLDEIASGNFGWVPAGSTSFTQTLTFNVGNTPKTPGVTVRNIGVLTLGAPNKDFAQTPDSTCAPKLYNSSTVCTVDVTFTPSATGLRRGAVVFTGADGNVLGTFPVFGTGTGSQIAFRPGTQATVSSKLIAEPMGVAIDGSGNLFVADLKNKAVEEIFAAGGYTNVKVLAPAYTKSPGFDQPAGVALDGAGNLFVTDVGDGVIRVIHAAGGYVNVAQLGSSPSAIFGVALDGQGNAYFPLPESNGVGIVTAASGYTSARLLPAKLDGPFGLAIDAQGNIFTTSVNDPVVQEISPADGYTSIKTFNTNANGPGQLALDAAGNIYVAGSGAGPALVHLPGKASFAANPNNNPLGDVEELTVASGYSTIRPLGSGFSSPFGIAVSADGNVVVTDTANDNITGLGFNNPPSLSFKNTPVNSITAPQQVEIANIGNQRLTFASINFPMDFLEAKHGPTVLPDTAPNNGPCTVSEPREVGFSCFLYIQFAPLSVGRFNENVTLTDNALNWDPATQLIPVQGTGIGASQTITFPVVASQTVGASLTLPATASSGLTVSYTSLTPSTCSVSGVTASLTAGGTCRFKASQSGNGFYAPAPDVYQYFWVNLKAQTVSFPQPPTQHLLTNTTLSATATSGLTVSFSSLTPAVCTVAGTTLTPVSVGTCTVTASQPGSSIYAPAGAYRNFHVALANQTISFSAPVNGARGAKLYLAASASSGLTVTYTSFSPSVCTVSGNALTLVSSGPCSIQASQPGNATYAAAPVVNQIIKVLGN